MSGTIPPRLLPYAAGFREPFPPPTAWELCSLRLLAITFVILLQGLLIAWLAHERQNRRRAERAARETMSKLTQLNRMATAGELSAAIAHEVNQPLTSIVTRANAALHLLAGKDNPDVDKARDALSEIVSAGHRAGDVVASVRAVFKKDIQDKSDVDINRVIWSVLGLVYIDLRKYSIELRTNLSEHSRSVVGSEVQLQQVVLNLIINAIESMHSTDHRILSVASELTGQNRVHVSIEDTGGGIEPANFDRIFKPLFSTKTGGMGMGLAICHSIIESHDGRIWVSAGASHGSIFHIELPAKCVMDNAPAIAP